MGGTKAQGFQFSHSIPSDTVEGQRVQEEILSRLAGCGFPEKVLFGIRLAIEEALVNAIKHGNQLDRQKSVHVRYNVSLKHFEIEIADEGTGFRPEDVPDPTAPENLERPCGRGLMLMRAYMTECEFIPPGNICRMVRKVE